MYYMHIADLETAVVKIITEETQKGNIKWEISIKNPSFYGQWGSKEIRLGWAIRKLMPVLRLKCSKGEYSIKGFRDSVKERLFLLRREVVNYCCKHNCPGREAIIKRIQQKSNEVTRQEERNLKNPVLLEFASVVEH